MQPALVRASDPIGIAPKGIKGFFEVGGDRWGETLASSQTWEMTRQLYILIQQVEKTGAGLIILDFGGNTIDTRTATGRAMLNMFATMAQFEREVMRERQHIDIARTRSQGKYRGRAPTARAKSNEMLALKAKGGGASEIDRQTGISRKSVYRILADR